MKINKYYQYIENTYTIYIFGTTEEKKPYLIIYSKEKFKAKTDTEGYAKIISEPPIVILQTKLRQKVQHSTY